MDNNTTQGELSFAFDDDTQPASAPATELNGEIVIAFVAAVGVNLDRAEEAAEEKLITLGYRVIRIRVTKDVLPILDPRASQKFDGDFQRFSTMMDIGNEARRSHGNDTIALGIAAAISKSRGPEKREQGKTAYFVHSLKHPDEVRKLRELYPRGFYLIGVHSPPGSKRKYLGNVRKMDPASVKKLMDRDRKENQKFGQKLVDTYHLSDFFVGWLEGDNDEEAEKSRRFISNNIGRFIEIIFGHPNRTPTFGEYSMFLAFSASLRSADLSRQVGAVITRNREILGTGANDCPKPNGGLYWPTLDRDTLLFKDVPKGRDWTRGIDSNRKQLMRVKADILKDARVDFAHLLRAEAPDASIDEETAQALEDSLIRKLDEVLEQSSIRDLTEFGRVVHAEMEALLSCARKGISTVDATLFSTTFPCHNCAKHIVAAGVNKVVFIEPYLKSKALDLHDDAIEIAYPNPLLTDQDQRPDKVQFEPFVGVGPRRFFDLFSMNIGVGREMLRKQSSSGIAKIWEPENAEVRIEIMTASYIERETDAAKTFAERTSKVHTDLLEGEKMSGRDL